MKAAYSFLFSLFLFSLFGCITRSNRSLPRVAIAGLGIESSTFSPAQTTEEAFHAQIGMEILENYPFLRPESQNREKKL